MITQETHQTSEIAFNFLQAFPDHSKVVIVHKLQARSGLKFDLKISWHS